MTHTMVAGTSEPQDFQLKDDGANLVGTGFTVGIVWSETTPAGPPTVAWLSQAAGTVRVTGCASMAVGKYPFRFSLTDGASAVGYCPNGDAPDEWLVVAR